MSKDVYIAIGAIIKDEGEYIEEWIEYHRLLGIEKFYLYDNGSTDNSILLLQKYIKEGIVELDYIEGPDRQIESYDLILEKHREDTQWIAFIDVDEFLYISNFEPNANAIADFLRGYEEYNGLGVYWITFGPSDHMNRPDGYVIGNYIYALPSDHYKNYHIKTIVQTDRAKHNVGVHNFAFLDGQSAVDEDKNLLIRDGVRTTTNPTKKIAIHHYYTKSIKEFMDRSAKGKACSAGWKSDIGVFKGGMQVMYGSTFETNDNLAKYVDFLPEREGRVRQMYFYGAGQFGIKALKHYLHNENACCELLGMIDKEKGGVVYGYEIFRPDVIKEASQEADIVITAHAAIAFEIQKELVALGVDKDRLYWYDGLEKHPELDFIENNCRPCGFWDENTLPYIEMHVTDVCNMNCRGCTHYSAVFKEDTLSYEDRLHDIRLLKKKFSHVIEFRLLGGEPLLSRHLLDYVVTVRELFPETALEIFTNGVLISKMTDEFYDCLRKHEVKLCVTLYPAIAKTKDSIKKHLEEKAVLHSVGSVTNKFNKPLSLAGSDSRKKHLCISDGCINLRNGSIARCPSVMYLNKLNETFGLSFPEDGIYPLETELSACELYEKLFQRIPLCDYCVENEISWERCGKEVLVTDFVSND